jgi:secreted trypsin-like serine protease
MFSLGKSFLLLSFSCLVTLVVTQETANNEYFPFVVSLKTNPYDEGYQHFCTGSIINSRWILTAAHCILRA